MRGKQGWWHISLFALYKAEMVTFALINCSTYLHLCLYLIISKVLLVWKIIQTIYSQITQFTIQKYYLKIRLVKWNEWSVAVVSGQNENFYFAEWMYFSHDFMRLSKIYEPWKWVLKVEKNIKVFLSVNTCKWSNNSIKMVFLPCSLLLK